MARMSEQKKNKRELMFSVSSENHSSDMYYFGGQRISDILGQPILRKSRPTPTNSKINPVSSLKDRFAASFAPFIKKLLKKVHQIIFLDWHREPCEPNSQNQSLLIRKVSFYWFFIILKDKREKEKNVTNRDIKRRI